jgi:aerobic carbon-monoxide dehydrogenase large subunit
MAEETQVMQPIAQRYTGTPIKRTEDTRILTGQGRYVDDIVLPGMLHAAFVRSHAAHARIVGLETGAARQAPGVVAVLTGTELEESIVAGPTGMAAMMGGAGPAFTILATTKVRLVGDPVVMVVAESRYLAEDACELVEVDYDELPPVASAETAIDPSSTPIFEDLGSNVLVRTPPVIYGDVDGAFARADRVVSAHLAQHRHQNVPMEGRGMVASFDPDTGELTVHASTQGVHMVRSTLAARLGLSPEQVRVVAGEIGGSFGLKIGASREEVAVAAVSKQLGRPVKWIEDRNENLTVSGQAREESFDVDAAVTDQGDILALRVRMLLDSGAYPGMGAMVGGIMQAVMPGPYKLQGFSFESTVAITNKASYVAYRGPWAAETFVRERMINLIAAELNMDPLAVRLRNVVTGGQPPTETVTGRSLAGVTARESLERIGEMVDFADFRRRQQAAREQGRLLGIGLATYIEAAPGPRGGGGPLGAERIRATLETDGTVVVYTGQMPHGQGHQTTLAQIVADQMGVPFAQVRVVVGDTNVVPEGMTGGSRAATMAGGASLHVARALRSRALDVAAELLEASPDDLDITDGRVSVRGVPASAISLGEVAVAAQSGRLPAHVESGLEVAITYDGGQGGWSGGTHCAEVEVDPGTGLVRIVRYVVAEDCGELINPAIVEGQVRGGVAQGVGAVLLERSAYDEQAQFLSGSFMDYLLPTATEVPHIEIAHLETVPLDADVNFRGVGEGGMIVAPPTLCNAIEDALAPYGAKVYEQHLPPVRILELIGAIEPDAAT